jgi:ureidoglycolate dehydrogenase (NAD+)
MAKRLSVENLSNFCISTLENAGMPSSDARTVADVLVMTDTWGTFSHGTGALRNYLKSLRAGGMNPRSKPKVVAEGNNWALIDGDSGMGMLGACLAMNIAIEKARTQAITWAGVRNSNHFGAAGYYATMAVRNDMLGIAMSNADPNMVIPGARGRIIGNNPLAYAVPAAEEHPIMLDIALSAVAAAKIIAMKERKEPIPSNWLTDAEGMPVDEVGDWPASGAMVPMAGHKGYGIALLIETLAALLPGANVLDEAKSWVENPAGASGLGHAFVVINPGIMMPIDDFKRRVDVMIRKLRGAPKAKNSRRVYLPGEMEWEHRENAIAKGIPLPAHVLASLHDAARYFSLDAGLLKTEEMED